MLDEAMFIGTWAHITLTTTKSGDEYVELSGDTSSTGRCDPPLRSSQNDRAGSSKISILPVVSVIMLS